MAGGIGTFRDDIANLVLDEQLSNRFVDRMAKRWLAAQQKLKGGALDANGNPLPNPQTQNQWGGKQIIKYNPTSDEVTAGIRQNATLLVWESPDGLPHYVTIEVGRIASGLGGPGNDIVGQVPVSAGAGTFPAGSDSTGNIVFSYRASAQVLIGTPGTMQDTFWIDLNRGQRFTALASYVAITAQMNAPGPPPTSLQTSVSGSMTAYATLGMAVAPSLAPVLYTQYQDPGQNPTGLPANVGFFKIIPPRANALVGIMSSVDSPTNPGRLVFSDNTGNTVGVMTFPIDAEAIGALPLPIPPDAYLVNVNFSPPGSDQTIHYAWRLIYQLSV